MAGRGVRRQAAKSDRNPEKKLWFISFSESVLSIVNNMEEQRRTHFIQPLLRG